MSNDRPFAVIFTSRLRPPADDSYGRMGAAMEALVATMPGYLGHDSARGADGIGITVSYWSDAAAIARFRAHAEHRLAQDAGRSAWYEWYHVAVAEVARQYSFGAIPDDWRAQASS